MDWAQINRIIEKFTENFSNLGSNIVVAGGKVKDSADKIENVIKSSTDNLSNVLVDLDKHIVDYSKSSNRQATAMMILTGALVLVGLLQVLIH
jgi:hypothetical protein